MRYLGWHECNAGALHTWAVLEVLDYDAGDE